MSILHKKAFGGLLFLVLVTAARLFIPAWTFDYWQAWTFLAVYFALSLAITLYLMKKDPMLLERRMRGGPTAEKEPAQKIIMVITSLGFISLIVFPALDHRFAWSHMIPYAALAGDVLVAIGWLAIFFVFKENTFTFATIELAPTKKSYQPVPTRWSGTRCMPEPLSRLSAYQLRRFVVGDAHHRRDDTRADMETV